VAASGGSSTPSSKLVTHVVDQLLEKLQPDSNGLGLSEGMCISKGSSKGSCVTFVDAFGFVIPSVQNPLLFPFLSRSQLLL
jgi:hypothetical protein